MICVLLEITIARTTIYISEFRGLELVSRITFAVFRLFKSQFKSRMPEEALDSSANDNDDTTSLTRSVPGQFDEPDLKLDRVSRVVCGDGATSLHSDEWQDSRIEQKDFMEKCQSSEKMMLDCVFACDHNIPGLLMTGYSFSHFLW